MKVRLVVAVGVMAATILLVVFLMASPEKETESAAVAPKEPVAKVPAEVLVGPQPAAGTGPAVTAPASPLPSDEERAEMEERIAASADRWPAGRRLKLWWFNPGPKMEEDAYEQARGLYLRFLDNFARIKSGRFHVEIYRIAKGGKEERIRVRDVVFSGKKYREESTITDEEPVRVVHLCDGKRYCEWTNGERGKMYSGGYPGLMSQYLFTTERSLIRENSVVFLNGYTHCDIDGGSTGYSRLWRENGYEVRFETSNGMLTDDGWLDRTYTYQQVGGFWFPLETVDRRGKRPDIEGYRWIYSQVVLNEPVDEAVFDVNQPF